MEHIRWYAVSEAFEEPGLYSPHPADWYASETAAMLEDGIARAAVDQVEWLGTDVRGRDDLVLEANVPPAIAQWVRTNAMVDDEEDE